MPEPSSREGLQLDGVPLPRPHPGLRGRWGPRGLLTCISRHSTFGNKPPSGQMSPVEASKVHRPEGDQVRVSSPGGGGRRLGAWYAGGPSLWG